MVIHLFFFIFFLLYIKIYTQSITNSNKCIEKAHTSLSYNQKELLCQKYYENYSIGPALCSVTAITYGLSINDTLELCSDSLSAYPAYCYKEIDQRERKQNGIKVCKHATSLLPSKCFNDLLKKKSLLNLPSSSSSLFTDALINFCNEKDDYASFNCVLTSISLYKTLPFIDILNFCTKAIGNGDIKNETSLNHIHSYCITKFSASSLMQTKYSSSNVKSISNIISFCSNNYPQLYYNTTYLNHFHIENLINPYHCVNKFYSDIALVKKLNSITSVTKDSNDEFSYDDGDNNDDFSYKNDNLIMNLCENSLTSYGPFVCVNDFLENYKKSSLNNLKISSSLLINLCKNSKNNLASKCFLDSNFKITNLKLKLNLCKRYNEIIVDDTDSYFNFDKLYHNYNKKTYKLDTRDGSIDKENNNLVLYNDFSILECYNTIRGYFKNDEESILLLCHDPLTAKESASCIAYAPKYLSNSEKIHLCSSAKNYLVPSNCLNSVISNVKNFKNSTKNILTVALDILKNDRDYNIRSSLLSLCSYENAIDPSYSSLCMNIVPKSLDVCKFKYFIKILFILISLIFLLVDAIYSCMHVESKDSIEYYKLCYKLIPSSFPSRAVSLLCDNLKSSLQTTKVINCAVELSHINNLPLDLNDISSLCYTENESGGVLSCMKSALRSYSKSYSAIYNNNTLSEVCSSAPNEKPGECLYEAVQLLKSNYNFDKKFVIELCQYEKYTSILQCLKEKYKNNYWTINNLNDCLESKREISTFKLDYIESFNPKYNQTRVYNMKKFSISFLVFDQYNELFNFVEDENEEKENKLVRLHLNEKNKEGSVLYGNKLSLIKDGKLTFNSLSISYPGQYEMSLYLNNKLLFSFQLIVYQDPDSETIPFCMHIFQNLICENQKFNNLESVDNNIEKFDNYNTKKFNSFNYFYLNVLCDVNVLKDWKVFTYLLPDGSLYSEYKTPIASIWTGLGLPRESSSNLENLGLLKSDLIRKKDEIFDKKVNEIDSNILKKKKKKKSSNSINNRNNYALSIIRKAYYQASLLWHPDRWVGFDKYNEIAEENFQLITRAYENLLKEYEQQTSNNSETIILENDSEPVYE